jgi:hypothetical protein
VFLFGTDGSLVERFAVLPDSDVAAAPDGGIYLRNQGALEYLSPAGEHTLLLENLSINRTDSEMFVTAEGQIVLWGVQGTNKLMLVSSVGEILWETALETDDLFGVRLAQVNACTLVMADQGGRLLAFDAQTGRLAGQVRVWGSHRNGVWLGVFAQDNIIRLHVADQLVGFDTTALSGLNCG